MKKFFLPLLLVVVLAMPFVHASPAQATGAVCPPPPPPPPPPGVNTLTVTPTVDCEGWSILIQASEGASISGSPGISGDWSQTTSVLVTVVATWTNGEPLSIEWSETLSMPEDCGVIPPPPPPPPQNTPVPPPWRPGAYACTVYTGVTTGTYEVFWLDGAGAIGGLSQPAQALDPDGGAQIFFTNTGNYVIVANGQQVVAQFSMPGCAPMDAPPATPAPPTGTGGPSVSSSLATGGAVLAFVAVLLGGAILFLVPRRISQDG